jgi:hypothetical protein
VPVRVAQGCVPLLEGNALGFQVVLEPGLRIRRGLGGIALETDEPLATSLEVRRSAALPRLVAQGFLRTAGAWERRLRKGLAWTERGCARLWTGLLVRPRRGVWLRVGGVANRRNLALDVADVHIADGDDFVPLVVDLGLRGEEAQVRGEVACLTPLRPQSRVVETTLARDPALGEAHAAFYDIGYFASKKRGAVTRKYRRLVAREPDPNVGSEGSTQIARIGPGQVSVDAADPFLAADATAPGPRADDGRRLDVVTFGNAVAFDAIYDGLTLTVDHDARALAQAAREVEAQWAHIFGAESVERDRRALWYLTKYFTPHPPGEPHFFVKPFAFTRTPPGWSSIIEGVHGDGYDVLRGVVSTDTFHATPAVFAVHRVGEPVHVAKGAPLVRVIPVPRDLLASTWQPVPFRDEAPRSLG